MDKKRCRVDTDESPETKRLRANILDILEDDVVDSFVSGQSDPNQSPVSNVEDLFTVMKSFEEEIVLPASASVSDFGESQPGLGYLLEASDDELGLPPTFSGEIDNYSSSGNYDELLLVEPEENPNSNLNPILSGGISDGLGQIWGFCDEIPSFEFYSGFDEIDRKESEESVVYEDLFDHSNDVIDEQSVFSWRQTGSFPAVQ